jgi:Domain of unknown function (DUF4160)
MVTSLHEAAWKIAIYGREHVEGRGFRCSISIATQELIIGSVPAPILKNARDRAREHRVELMAKWWELNR